MLPILPFYANLNKWQISFYRYVMLLLMVTNTSRNELMYKLRNHNMTLDRLMKVCNIYNNR